MIISDLEHLEAISELSSIVSGGCSIQYSLVEGVVSVISQGAPLQTTLNQDGSTTYTCQDGTSVSSLTVGSSLIVVTTTSVVT